MENQRYYFHLTARTQNDLYFRSPISKIWNYCLESFAKNPKRNDIDFIGFVLMSNHYHLLIRAKFRDMQIFMENFQLPSMNEYYFETIQSNRYLKYSYRYIYQNPLRAKLANRVQDYPYSVIHYLYNQKEIELNVFDKYGFNDEYKSLWLNKESPRDPGL